jgi:predicted phage-related endonuclease
MVKELTRIPADVCKYVVEVYAADGDPLSAITALSHYITAEPEKKRVKGEIPDGMQATIEELMMVKHQLDELTEREKELKKQVLTAMQNVNEDSWCNDLIQFTRKAAYERESIDSKELKAKMPEVYESFKKTTKVAESISYKLL